MHSDFVLGHTVRSATVQDFRCRVRRLEDSRVLHRYVLVRVRREPVGAQREVGIEEPTYSFSFKDEETQREMLAKEV